MSEYWEVRENGERYCHCGKQETAWDLVRMKPGIRTCHKINIIPGQVIDVAVKQILELPGQLGLPSAIMEKELSEFQGEPLPYWDELQS